MKSSFSDKTTRIIGGQVAQSPIPWQAGLLVDNSLVCGATIIDEETVLTTTFCVYKDAFSNPPVPHNPASLKIEAGVVSSGDATAQLRGVSEIIVHPCHRKEEVTIDRYVPYSRDQNHWWEISAFCLLSFCQNERI